MCICVDIYLCLYVSASVCVMVCCMHMYIHTHIHTHTHELWIEERAGIWAHMPLCAGEELISFKSFFFVVLVSSFESRVFIEN